jgi:hypothetical protein
MLAAEFAVLAFVNGQRVQIDLNSRRIMRAF